MVLAEIDRFLRKTGMTRTRFGREALNDPKLIGDLAEGRQLREPTRRRVLAYIAAAERRA